MNMKPRSASPQQRSAITDAILTQLETHPEVLWAYLHGSFLEPGPYRDIDVAVWVDPRRVTVSDWTSRWLSGRSSTIRSMSVC